MPETMPERPDWLEALRSDALADASLSLYERERREAVLRDIAARVQQDGAHSARPHPNRARQFMPFAALRGFHELVHERSQE